MSVMIKGIKIPKNCYECDAIGISDIVGLNCNGIDYEDRFVNRPPDCPVRSISQNWEKILNMRSYALLVERFYDDYFTFGTATMHPRQHSNSGRIECEE